MKTKMALNELEEKFTQLQHFQQAILENEGLSN